MNSWIWISRKLKSLRKALVPQHNREGPVASLQRFFAYEALSPIERWIRNRGYQKLLHSPDPGNAGFEIRRSLFRRLKLYVEGYLADISHRHFEEAPNPMPADQKVRKQWGQKMLEKLFQKYDDRKFDEYSENLKYAHHRDRGEDWAEIKRIYKWLTEDWPQWQNPYWEKAPSPTFKQGKPISFSSKEEQKKFNQITDRAERLDWITEERVRGRARRLFNRRHLLRYD